MEKFTEYFNEEKDFKRLSNCTEKVEIAISRLENPVGITDELIVMYQDYLFKEAGEIAVQFVDLNKLYLYPLLVKYKVIKKTNIMQLIEYARENKNLDALSYLMNVNNQLRTGDKSLSIAKKHIKGKTPLPQPESDYSRAKAGEIIWFGRKPIPWRVLENKAGQLLVISLFALECMPFEDFYDPFYYTMSFDRTRWPYSSIRRKVNGEFFTNLLTEEQRQKVIPVYIDADDNLQFEEDNSLKKDYMFFLSEKEAIRYMKSPKDRLAPVTAFAVRSNLYHIFEDYAYWWLRTPGQFGVEKVYVLDGQFTSKNSLVGGDHFNFLGVRPAMYIKF